MPDHVLSPYDRAFLPVVLYELHLRKCLRAGQASIDVTTDLLTELPNSSARLYWSSLMIERTVYPMWNRTIQFGAWVVKDHLYLEVFEPVRLSEEALPKRFWIQVLDVNGPVCLTQEIEHFKRRMVIAMLDKLYVLTAGALMNSGTLP